MSVATVEVVADTNIVIWYFLEPDKLTAAARDALETETAAGRPGLAVRRRDFTTRRAA